MDVQFELIEKHLQTAELHTKKAIAEGGNSPAMEEVFDALFDLKSAIGLLAGVVRRNTVTYGG